MTVNKATLLIRNVEYDGGIPLTSGNIESMLSGVTSALGDVANLTGGPTIFSYIKTDGACNSAMIQVHNLEISSSPPLDYVVSGVETELDGVTDFSYSGVEVTYSRDNETPITN